MAMACVTVWAAMWFALTVGILVVKLKKDEVDSDYALAYSAACAFWPIPFVVALLAMPFLLGVLAALALRRSAAWASSTWAALRRWPHL